jgi:hypothetical protein
MQDDKDPYVPWEVKTNSCRKPSGAPDARSTTKLQLEDRGETARLHMEMELPWKVALKVLDAVYVERRRDEATSTL